MFIKREKKKKKKTEIKIDSFLVAWLKQQSRTGDRGHSHSNSVKTKNDEMPCLERAVPAFSRDKSG